MVHTIVWKAAGAIVLGGALSLSSMAEAATFPAPLLGKSVTVNWTVNTQLKMDDTGEIVFTSMSASLQIYISTAGRTFARQSVSVISKGTGMSRRGLPRTGVGTSYQEERAPGDRTSSLAGRSVDVVHMEGGVLAADRKMREGARRAAVTFDNGYTSCNARVILGREGGTGALRNRNPLTGRGYEIVSVNVATSSCSVTSGNVFGGQ